MGGCKTQYAAAAAMSGMGQVSRRNTPATAAYCWFGAGWSCTRSQAVPALTDSNCRRKSGLPEALPVSCNRSGNPASTAGPCDVSASSEDSLMAGA